MPWNVKEHETHKLEKMRQEGFEILRKVSIFADFRDDMKLMLELSRKLHPFDFHSGDIIVKKGGHCLGALVLVVDGKADVVVEKGFNDAITVYTFRSGGYFGELGIVIDNEPNASILVPQGEVCKTLMLNRADFEAVMEKFPEVKKSLMEIVQQRTAAIAANSASKKEEEEGEEEEDEEKEKEEEAQKEEDEEEDEKETEAMIAKLDKKEKFAFDSLRGFPLFSPAVTKGKFFIDVVSKMTPAEYKSGETITTKGGDNIQALVFVVEGKADVISPQPGQEETVVFTFKPGSLFSEMGLFTEMKHTATVMIPEESETQTKVLLLKRKDFENVLEKYPTEAQGILKLAQERIKLITQQQK